jgi:outer membrane murein-binding lipoprotein Lpp
MSHPPTDPNSWSLGDRWRHADERGGHPTGPAPAPTPRQADAGWPVPNGDQPPQPRAYGRATATARPSPQGYGQPPSSSHGYGQPPSSSQVYGQPPSSSQVYGQPPSAPQTHGPSAATYGRPTAVTPYAQPPSVPQAYGRPAAYGQPTTAAPFEPSSPTSLVQQPASPPPAYGAAEPASVGGPARWKKPGPVLTVALVAGLLLVLSGVLTVLFVLKSSELSRAEGELRSQSAQVEQLRKDLQAANDRAAKSQQDLTGTKNARDELERQKQVISRCLKLLGEAGSAARDGDRSAYNDAIEAAEPVCKEADRYL